MSLVARIIAEDAIAMEQLRAVRELDLPDWCIAAGFVRNRVWDHLHGIVPARLPVDIDVIYFDAGDVSRESEAAFASRLAQELEALVQRRDGHAGEALHEDLAVAGPVLERAGHVIPAVPASDLILAHDVVEVERLLKSMGVDVNVVAPLGASPQDLLTIPNADANVSDGALVTRASSEGSLSFIDSM